LGVAFLIFLPWVVYMDLRFKDFWDTYFVYSDFSRVVTPLEGRTNDYFFYFKYLATGENHLWVGLLPFSVGLVAFKTFIKRSKANTLLLVWIVIVLLFFTLAQTKLYWYILPVIPAFSIAIGYFIFELLKQTRLILCRLHHRYGKPSNQELTNAPP
jgi:4-amino-4-deoxy-L-arabinose transferase-like glycosyltransferase